MLKKIKIFFSFLTFFSVFSVAFFFSAGLALAALSCSVSSSCTGSDVVVFRMSATSNSHAELPSQSNYSQLVCCTGVSGLSNSCSGNYGVVLRLSGDTNAHVEENTESTATYDGSNACLSVSSGTVTIGYQNSSCSGFDTTVASLSSSTTNAHVGDASTYTRKVCATISGVSPSPGSGGGSRVNDPPIPIDQNIKEEILKISDFNNDGRVNILDLSILLYYIDNPSSPVNKYDLNGDGVLDFLDISILFYYWDLVF